MPQPPSPTDPPPRFSQLDALRGLAAPSVVTSHLANFMPGLRFMALNPLIRSHEAVLLFFVLSGFVLALPAHAGRPLRFPSFWVRRLVRLYLPFALAMGLAYAASLVVPHHAAKSFTWLGTTWCRPLDAGQLARLFSLVAPADTHALLPVAWSLIHELRVSLVFPLVVLLSRRVPWWLLLVVGPTVSAAAFASGAAPAAPSEWAASLLGTLHYFGMFVGGAMLARHHEAVGAAWRRLALPARLAIAGASGGLYMYGHLTLSRLGWPLWATDWAIAVAAGGLIATVMSSSTARAWLSTAPALALGRASYSLYLIHPIVILALLYTGLPHVPVAALLATALGLSLVLAEGMYRWVERPSVALGRTLATALDARLTPKSAVDADAPST